MQTETRAPSRDRRGTDSTTPGPHRVPAIRCAAPQFGAPPAPAPARCAPFPMPSPSLQSDRSRLHAMPYQPQPMHPTACSLQLDPAHAGSWRAHPMSRSLHCNWLVPQGQTERRSTKRGRKCPAVQTRPLRATPTRRPPSERTRAPFRKPSD
eukprot:410572-Prymnesium_polylepis.1